MSSTHQPSTPSRRTVLQAGVSLAAALATGATGVQPYGLHAAEAAAAATEVGLEVLRPIDPGENIADIPLDQYPLFDSKSKAGDGNGGRMVDPASLPVSDRAFVLAGGLTPSNVSQIIASARPWGVDVSSGVESAPGRKDVRRVRAFINAAKAAEPPGFLGDPEHMPYDWEEDEVR